MMQRCRQLLFLNTIVYRSNRLAEQTFYGRLLLLKAKVHYASWSETCSKPAGDLRASWSQTCVIVRVVSRAQSPPC